MAEKAAKAPPSQNPKAQTAPDLRALENAYQIVGELHASDGVRQFLGRRRHDGADVTISVFTPPAGGQSNELTHYAADAQQRAGGLRDAHVVDIYEARWLGSNALAVVGERAAGITLDELLERGEEFSNPRVAAALKDVAGALEWARTHDIVHRGVTPESMYFDEGDERVRVSFVPMPLPLTGAADAQGDAKTIGKLAWAMLTGERYSDNARLAELAPNLATRVVDVVERLVRSRLGTAPVDVPTAIGIIASGDVLKQAEVEIAAMKEEYDEQHRAALAKCETHRLETEQQAAEAAAALGDERADLHRQIAERRSDFERERAEFDRVMAERQQQLAMIRAELEAQAEGLESRLAEFDARRTEFEEIVRERQRELMAAVKKGEKVPAPSPQFNAFTKRKKEKKAQKPIRGVFAPLDKPALKPDGPSKFKRWALPIGFGLVGAALVGAIVTIHNHNARDEGPARFGSTTNAPQPAAPDGRGGFLSQSAGGTVVPRPTSPYARPGDSVAAKVNPDTTTVVDTPKPRPKPKEIDPREGLPAPPSAVVPREPVRRDTIMDTMPARDTAIRSETPAPRDSFRADTVRRDTMVGRDTFGRRDTMRSNVTSTIVRRDSIVRSDTTIIKRDTIRVRPDSIIR